MLLTGCIQSGAHLGLATEAGLLSSGDQPWLTQVTAGLRYLEAQDSAKIEAARSLES